MAAPPVMCQSVPDGDPDWHMPARLLGREVLELEWQHNEAGFTYLVTLDNKIIKGFRHSALARLVWEVLADQNPATYREISAAIEAKFYGKGAEIGETDSEVCSEGFTRWVYATIGA